MRCQDKGRYTVQGAERFFFHAVRVGRLRVASCAIKGANDKGAQTVVDLLDALDVRLDDLARRKLAHGDPPG